VDVRKVARDELARFPELADWNFAFSRAKTQLGLCRFQRKTIYISAALLPHMPDKQVLDTIRHEIAHALAYVHDGHTGHGEPWQQWCSITGASPNRTARLESRPEYRYAAVLDGRVLKRYHRKPRHNLAACIVNGDRSTLGRIKLVKL